MNIIIEVIGCENVSSRTERNEIGIWDRQIRDFSKWKEGMKSDATMEQMAGDFIVIKLWIQAYNVKGDGCTDNPYHPRECCVGFEIENVETSNDSELP